MAPRSDDRLGDDRPGDDRPGDAQAGAERAGGERGAVPPPPAIGLGSGLQFGLTLVLFTLGGVWLDRTLGSVPAFTLVGLALGAVGATVSLVKRVGAHTRRAREHRDGGGAGR